MGLRRTLIALCMGAWLAGCVAIRPMPTVKLPWEQRQAELAHAQSWQMEGRVAVVFGEQGWQANLDWQQQVRTSHVHLAGPLGIGAVVLTLTPDGVSLDGGEHGNAALADLQNRLGFALPLAHLRYWVLGIPDPAMAADTTANDLDRLQRLSQDGWSVEYDRYGAVDVDVLPTKLVLSRDTVRVRMSVDHWTLRP